MPNSLRIYIDSCCFIDVVKHSVGKLTTNRDKDNWFVKKLLEASRNGDIQLYTSVLTAGECVAIEAGQASVPAEIQEHFRNLITSGQYVHLVSPTPKMTGLIQDFRWKHNLVLGSADAIHLASGIEAGCVEFVTTDDRLQKAKFKPAVTLMPALGMPIITASATGQLPVKYLQPSIFDATTTQN